MAHEGSVVPLCRVQFVDCTLGRVVVVENGSAGGVCGGCWWWQAAPPVDCVKAIRGYVHQILKPKDKGMEVLGMKALLLDAETVSAMTSPVLQPHVERDAV